MKREALNRAALKREALKPRNQKPETRNFLPPIIPTLLTINFLTHGSKL